MVRHVDDDDSVLALQLAAKNIRGVCVQRACQSAFRHELRNNDGDGFAMLAALGNFGNVFQQRLEEEAIGGIQHHHAHTLSPCLPFLADFFGVSGFDTNMHRRNIVGEHSRIAQRRQRPLMRAADGHNYPMTNGMRRNGARVFKGKSFGKK